MDQEYIKDLSSDEKKWLSDFNEEYYGANLDFENLDNNRFHKTEEEKKACTDRVNARNRCQYGKARAMNKINDYSTITIDNESVNIDIADLEMISVHTSSMMIEDALIEYLDSKDSEET